MEHLREVIPGLPLSSGDASLPWSFDASNLAGTADFYNKVLPYHPILNMEYSLLCAQLCHDFSNLNEDDDKEQILGRLFTALLYNELLEQVHLHYLDVPREVLRLREQKKLYRKLLLAAGYAFTSTPGEEQEVQFNGSWSRWVSDTTAQTNTYRLLVNRINRLITLSNTVIRYAQPFNRAAGSVAQLSTPFLSYFNLVFHAPRLFVNLGLMAKHMVPGVWMSKEEQSIALSTRFVCQVQRRWFELGNDAVWTTISAINIFLLCGAMASGAVYLSFAGFAFDMLNAIIRISIVLNRLYTLKNEYTKKLEQEQDPARKKFIETHVASINKRIEFEQARLGIHVAGTSLVCAAMIFALPVLAVNPVLILASALFLFFLWGITFELTRQLDMRRPNDVIEQVVQDRHLRFFSGKKEDSEPTPDTDDRYSPAY
jgi:hypothetical protein